MHRMVFTLPHHSLWLRKVFRFLFQRSSTKQLIQILREVKTLFGMQVWFTLSIKHMSTANKREELVSLWNMRKVETIEEFYQRKFEGVPGNIRNEIGHFNVFKLDPFVGNNATPVPYSSEFTDRINSGFFCVFTTAFFHQYGNLDQYTVFQPGGTHVFELTDEQVNKVTGIYKSMFEEIDSDYVHKYDVLRNLVFELLHFAMKLPSAKFDKQPINASQRISTLFLELMERQFPIDDSHQTLNLRSASDFAQQLNVHVNHLNRAVKETTEKTTSQIVAERILRESKILLKHSVWNVSEIAYALGFTETTHFNNFFKKHVQLSPLKFRNV